MADNIIVANQDDNNINIAYIISMTFNSPARSIKCHMNIIANIKPPIHPYKYIIILVFKCLTNKLK